MMTTNKTSSSSSNNKQDEVLSTEIVRRGIEGSGPYAGSLSFSVKVRRGIPDFLSSVNLKYVKLGYTSFVAHKFYIPPFLPLLLVIYIFFSLGKLTWKNSIPSTYDDIFVISNTIFAIAILPILVYYANYLPRSTYLVDFACYRPPNHLKISRAEFIDLAKKSGNFDDDGIEFQCRVLSNSGIGDESYLPRTVFIPGRKRCLKEGREEAAMVMFGAVDNLLAKTGFKVKEIKILVVNCSTLNPTPSLASMLINHYKLQKDIQSYNLGGMGCSAGAIAVDLGKDLLNAHRDSYALVVSTEVVSFTWYNGKEKEMILPNCFFRMGAAAMLLSNRSFDKWRAKYELVQTVRTHKGTENRSFESIYGNDDSEENSGLVVKNEDLFEVGGEALKANMTTLGPLVLPLSEQMRFFMNLILKKKKPYIPDFKLAFEHVCILATSKRVLVELQKNLELTEEYMEASIKTLERFGNTSSSSVWYELAYLEANSKIKKGDRICQISFGSGFKCNSVVLKALRNVNASSTSETNPWMDEDTTTTLP